MLRAKLKDGLHPAGPNVYHGTISLKACGQGFCQSAVGLGFAIVRKVQGSEDPWRPLPGL